MSLREGDRRAGTWTNSWEGMAGWNGTQVCCTTLSSSQEEGYAIVDDTSAKMEGRDILENGYDALVEVYCALLLNGRL